jgi:hypothetical protein
MASAWAIGAAAIVLTTPATAAAQIPSATGVYTACIRLDRDGDEGRLARLIDPARERCKRNEAQVSWNEKGLKGDKGDKGFKGDTGDRGDKGATGDKGDQGSQGPQGPQGASGVVRAYGRLGPQTQFFAGDAPKLLTAFCDPGDLVTGGGLFYWEAGADKDQHVILESSATGLWMYPPDEDPALNQPEGGWKVGVKYNGTWTTILSASVQCLDVTP